MKFQYNLTVTDVEGNIIAEASKPTMEMLEECIRSVEKAVTEYEGEMEVGMQNEIDRQKEDEVYYAADMKGGKAVVDKEANTTEPY